MADLSECCTKEVNISFFGPLVYITTDPNFLLYIFYIKRILWEFWNSKPGSLEIRNTNKTKIFLYLFIYIYIYIYIFFFWGGGGGGVARSMDPTINGLITGVCLWSHHDRRQLKICILMSTFMRHDNVDYVITNRHWQKDHLLHLEFISLKCHFRIRNLIESQLMRSSELEVMKMCVI